MTNEGGQGTQSPAFTISDDELPPDPDFRGRYSNNNQSDELIGLAFGLYILGILYSLMAPPDSAVWNYLLFVIFVTGLICGLHILRSGFPIVFLANFLFALLAYFDFSFFNQSIDLISQFDPNNLIQTFHSEIIGSSTLSTERGYSHEDTTFWQKLGVHLSTFLGALAMVLLCLSWLLLEVFLWLF